MIAAAAGSSQIKKDGVQAIASFAADYVRDCLNDSWFKKESLEKDWWGGLQLLLRHSFFQGRTDEVSQKVEAAAMPVLCRHFEGRSASCLAQPVFDQVRQDLAAVVGKGKIGKSRDIEMLIGIFQFVSKLPEENLAIYSVGEVRSGRLRGHYDELRAIPQIGPKIASFYLRDLVCIYGLDDLVKPEDLQYLQPIDVWVRKVADNLEITGGDNVPEEEVRLNIIRTCEQCGVSAFRFNQGAWYLGKNAFGIAIQRILESHRVANV